VSLVGCAVNPVTGKREFTLVSESQEIAMGREADPQIVATYGLYDDAELAAYVDAIGQRMVKISHRPDLHFTFRVLDSPVINAFALPGGYVYVTRGILAHMNNEAELAVVLGHEIGHVTAKHGVQRQTSATLAGLGLGLGGALVPAVARYSPLLEQSLALLFLKYGRDDEHQADELGVEYSLAAGFDPEVGAKFFEVLDRQMQESGASLPGWLSTHPDPGDRVQRTRRLARDSKSAVTGALTVGDGEHKAKIDGVVFGVDPRQGYVQGDVFLHPDMRFTVTFPTGWTIQNTPSALLGGDEEGTMQVQLTLEDAEGLGSEEYIRRLATNAQAEVVSVQAMTIGGHAAQQAVLSIPNDAEAQKVLITCIRRHDEENLFRFLGVAQTYSSAAVVLQGIAGSFADLTDRHVLQVQPMHVRVEILSRDQSLQAVLQGLPQMPVDVATVALLNNLQVDSPLSAGFRLKIVQGSLPGTD
jgi:predicted Zn-dependent protease